MLRRKILITRGCLMGLESAWGYKQIIRTVTGGIQRMLVRCLEYHQTKLSGSFVRVDLLLDITGKYGLSSHTDYYFSTEFFPSYTEYFLSTETLSSLDKSTPLARVQTSLHWTRKMLSFLRFLQMVTSDFTWYSHTLTSHF